MRAALVLLLLGCTAPDGTVVDPTWRMPASTGSASCCAGPRPGLVRRQLHGAEAPAGGGAEGAGERRGWRALDDVEEPAVGVGSVWCLSWTNVHACFGNIDLHFCISICCLCREPRAWGSPSCRLLTASRWATGGTPSRQVCSHMQTCLVSRVCLCCPYRRMPKATPFPARMWPLQAAQRGVRHATTPSDFARLQRDFRDQLREGEQAVRTLRDLGQVRRCSLYSSPYGQLSCLSHVGGIPLAGVGCTSSVLVAQCVAVLHCHRFAILPALSPHAAVVPGPAAQDGGGHLPHWPVQPAAAAARLPPRTGPGC